VLFVQLLAVHGPTSDEHLKDFNHADVIFTFVVSHPRAHRLVAADPNAEPKAKKPRKPKSAASDSGSAASAEELAAGITEELKKLGDAETEVKKEQQ
jgi:hypothetical protein